MLQNKISEKGMATAYVAIFDSTGKPIFDPLSNLPIGIFVTDFNYTFIEEKSDTASFTILTDNPNLVDLPKLSQQSVLKLQWGFIFEDGTSDSSQVRTVSIADHSVDFNENGITIKYSCTDLFSSVAKQNPADLENRIFNTWVKNNIEGKFGFEIVNYNSKPKLYTNE